MLSLINTTMTANVFDPQRPKRDPPPFLGAWAMRMTNTLVDMKVLLSVLATSLGSVLQVYLILAY